MYPPNDSLEHSASGAGLGIQRQMQWGIEMRRLRGASDGASPGGSLACLSSPLVLALQVRARCLRPKHSLGLQARSSQPLGGLQLATN